MICANEKNGNREEHGTESRGEWGCCLRKLVWKVLAEKVAVLGKTEKRQRMVLWEGMWEVDCMGTLITWILPKEI